MNTKSSNELFKRSVRLMPGGVNSPVRAFQAVGGNPIFMERADGAYLYDVEGNRYLDYVLSWGPMILGHNHPAVRDAVCEAASAGLSFGASTEAELLMASEVTALANIDMVRMVNSGTEAVMSALRLARGYTGRDKLIKFDGCYHGHTDSMLVKAGSGLLTAGIPDSRGIPAAVAADTLVAAYNDIESVKDLFAGNYGQVAAVIIEPVCANQGVITPKPGFLTELRDLCDENGALLIFDEVITGFRLGSGGAQGYYGVRADLVTYGKIIGGGMPVGAYGGRREIMELVAPSGPVYQAGTLSGNPLAMAAGLAVLWHIKENPYLYEYISELGERLRNGFNDMIRRRELDAKVDGVGSLCCLFLGRERYGQFFKGMLQRGIYLAPSQYEAMFLSTAHTQDHIEETLQKAEQVMEEIN